MQEQSDLVTDKHVDQEASITFQQITKADKLCCGCHFKDYKSLFEYNVLYSWSTTSVVC